MAAEKAMAQWRRRRGARVLGCRAVEGYVAGVAAYLDDMTIVAHPDVAAAGMQAFAAECAARGWTVNARKTVCGAGYYKPALGLDLTRSNLHTCLRFGGLPWG